MNSNTYTLMTNRTAEPSLRKAARIAGLLYLTIIVAGIFAQFVVRSSLIVPGDATATADNIVASEGLFRLGIAGDLIMIMCDVALALVFYVLLKPVNRSLALLAAFFRLAQAAALGINLLNLFFVLQLLSGADYLAVLGADQSNALVLLFLDAHATGYRIALVFFGLSIFVLGYLLVRSGYFPRILGIGMIVAAFGYLIDSSANFLLPNYSDYEAVFSVVVFAPAIIAELSLCLWLLWKGVNVRQRDTHALTSTTQAEGAGA
jgi:hypothetical protein